jgi:micrococcal nuclease
MARVDRGTRVFWMVVVALLVASTFFAVRAESVRRSVQRAAAVDVQTGDVLSFAQVQDGDTVVLADAAGSHVTVRVVGIKSFDASSEKDAAAVHAREAIAAVERALRQRPIRVMLASPPKDKHGRALASLYVDDVDVALQLVRDGRVMAYTQYPFPAMADYLRAQAEARAEKRGFWADPVASERAHALFEQWKKGAP